MSSYIKLYVIYNVLEVFDKLWYVCIYGVYMYIRIYYIRVYVYTY